MDRYGTGVKGERLAKEYLEKNGYYILDMNINYPNVGELDIVAKLGNTLVFVEVKDRFDSAFGNPFEAVTKGKQQKIIKASKRYLMDKKVVCDYYRYDVIAIFDERVEHLEDAFMAKW